MWRMSSIPRRWSNAKARASSYMKEAWQQLPAILSGIAAVAKRAVRKRFERSPDEQPATETRPNCRQTVVDELYEQAAAVWQDRQEQSTEIETRAIIEGKNDDDDEIIASDDCDDSALTTSDEEEINDSSDTKAHHIITEREDEDEEIEEEEDEKVQAVIVDDKGVKRTMRTGDY